MKYFVCYDPTRKNQSSISSSISFLLNPIFVVVVVVIITINILEHQPSLLLSSRALFFFHKQQYQPFHPFLVHAAWITRTRTTTSFHIRCNNFHHKAFHKLQQQQPQQCLQSRGRKKSFNDPFLSSAVSTSVLLLLSSSSSSSDTNILVSTDSTDHSQYDNTTSNNKNKTLSSSSSTGSSVGANTIATDISILNDNNNYNNNDNNNNTNLEDIRIARKLRFAGVGRLYAAQIRYQKEQEQKKQNKNNNNNNNNQKKKSNNQQQQQQQPDVIVPINDDLNEIDNKIITTTSDDDDVLERLRLSTVIVIGLGGVGSWAVEALCRSGIGNLILIDCDDICISNTNRQLHALHSTIGQYKINSLERRLQDINPDCYIHLIHDFVTEHNVQEILQTIQNTIQTQQEQEHQQQLLLSSSPEGGGIHTSQKSVVAVLDAIDNSYDKAALLACCIEHDFADVIVSVGGCAGILLDGSGSGTSSGTTTTNLIRQDLTDVVNDKLLRTTRKILRSKFHFPSGQKFHDKKRKNTTKPWNIDCIYSIETPPPTTKSNLIMNMDDHDDSSSTGSFRTCDGVLGTVCHVTGSLGFMAAGRILDRIAFHDITPVPCKGL